MAGNAAIIYLKASERRATLCGMNAPIGHAVQLIHTVAAPRKDHMQEMQEVLNELLGSPKDN